MFRPDENAFGTAPGRAAILLAAGGSKRLGRPKQLIPMGGKSLLRRAAEAAVGSGASPVIVVLGGNADLLTPELDGLGVTPVVNREWQEGMGRSLRCGVEALEREAPQAAAVLLMVCDQPRITAAHLKDMWARHGASGKVVAVRYGDHPGVPAILPSTYMSELAKMTGDKGARSLLRALPATDIDLVELPEADFDLDTAEDLRRLEPDASNSL